MALEEVRRKLTMGRQLVIRSVERAEYINVMELSAEYIKKFNEYLYVYIK